LPAEVDLAGDELIGLCYRAMALSQAMRARRGSALHAAEAEAGLVADVYLLLEAYAADETLAAMLPGLASSIDDLRRISLERRPPAESFPPRRQPIEQLARELLESR